MAAFFFWDERGGLTLPWNQLKGVPREPLSLMFSCYNKDLNLILHLIEELLGAGAYLVPPAQRDLGKVF